MGEGASHYLHPLPAFIIGSCGGYFNTGRYVRYGNTDPASDGDFGTNGYQPHNRLLASLCNAMGVPATYYGDQQYGGPLDELV
jgi:transglutaminase-like putative cysteine protease